MTNNIGCSIYLSTRKKKKYYGLQVHTLTFLKVDENGDSIDDKQYEYTGDHSGFCDGIEDEYLQQASKG